MAHGYRSIFPFLMWHWMRQSHGFLIVFRDVSCRLIYGRARRYMEPSIKIASIDRQCFKNLSFKNLNIN